MCVFLLYFMVLKSQGSSAVRHLCGMSHCQVYVVVDFPCGATGEASAGSGCVQKSSLGAQ